MESESGDAVNKILIEEEYLQISMNKSSKAKVKTKLVEEWQYVNDKCMYIENMCTCAKYTIYANLEASISLESQSSAEVFKLSLFFDVP